MALRARLRTTPGRLRLAAVVLALAAIAFGIAMATAAASREQAADAVATRTEPLLLEADGLYASLSDADATADRDLPHRRARAPRPPRGATWLISRRPARGSRRSRAQVGRLGRTRAAAATIATRMPVYSGLIEAARVNNRQGLPVGAAYLRRASGIMRDELLPAPQAGST